MKFVKKIASCLKKIRITRWHAELAMLGILLIPVMYLIMWIEQSSGTWDTALFSQKLLIGVVAGVLGLAVWVLGGTVIVVNILKDMLTELREIRKNTEQK